MILNTYFCYLLQLTDVCPFAFASLVCISIGIASSVVGSKIPAITARIKSIS